MTESQLSEYAACLAGLKGAVFLEIMLSAGRAPARVCSYRQNGDASRSYERIDTLCTEAGIELSSPLALSDLRQPVVFFIGWQLMTAEIGANHVVMHDSLLPAYRGFAPTVAALINGEREIGATAFLPEAEVDAGAIVMQRKWGVSYPMRIRDALVRQAQCMAEMAASLLDQPRSRWLTTEQPTAGVSYSIWRDELDYRIDWSASAETIARFVDAVSDPYRGASTMFAGSLARVVAAQPVADVNFVARHPGKVWRFENGAPVIVCGEGLLRLDELRDEQGRIVLVDKLRTRFN